MDLRTQLKDCQQNTLIASDIPEVCKSSPCCLGIDEAGRGPVLGPMVYGVSFSPLEKNNALKELGFADSKTLTEEKREELFTKLSSEVDYIGWAVDIISPVFISNCMLKRTKHSLNAVSHDSAIGLIRHALDSGANIQEVYVDTVGDPAKYQALLLRHFPNLDITVAKKADATYPIVSAASICAKVARDRALRIWRVEEGLTVDPDKYGSGYPGDATTKKFMTDNIDRVFGFPNIVRFAWSTAGNIMEKKCAAVAWEDDEEEEGAGDNTPSVMSFFKKTTASGARARHEVFTRRHVENVGQW